MTYKSKDMVFKWRIKMRRSDKEVKEFKDIVAIMKKCDVCRVALNNNGYLYILPLNSKPMPP